MHIDFEYIIFQQPTSFIRSFTAPFLLGMATTVRKASRPSSAVTERSHALCPSVVSLNKIITHAESFIIVT